MINLSASTSALSDVEGPSDSDLLSVEDVDLDGTDWEALLEPVVKVTTKDEDFWAEDENVHDDRYDGEGVPSWSAWA